jgi:hypothetical protein
MKALVAFCMLLFLATVALAKPAPLSWQPLSVTTAIDSGHAATMMEANYFRALPPPPAVGKIFPCQLRLFDKTRIARSCN